jgi:hypothetical protein
MTAIRTVTAIGAVAALVSTNIPAHAFCGFYVAGSNEKMFNDATQVVLMRDGTRTILTMQNDYRGPVEDFAMVVPVPVVLKPTDVKVVDKGVFERVDALGSPRLVEYWEQDPCPSPMEMQGEYGGVEGGVVGGAPMPTSPSVRMAPPSHHDAAPAPKPRPAVPPVLASFSATPATVTAGVPTPITWSFNYSNTPWPEPSCVVDHGVGAVASGVASNVTLGESTMLTLSCANSAGKSEKQFKINAVKIEAKFDVAEYQIVILSATEAAGLQDWLKLNGYRIPDGAEPLLRPYIESGSKFFVARVDPKKVHMVDGHIALSPLRFHYDSEEFSLPIRLGLANSSGKQDLIVNILSADKRYEVANYKNVFIPTNFDVKPGVKTRFGEFYAALFDKTIEASPRAVVTEYAWTAVPNYHCDPCTNADVTSPDLITLGGDVVGGRIAAGTFVLTRLHARYTAADMKDDLRFREASPVTGGREQWSKQGLEYGAVASAQNYFQARYAIRHYWTGPMRCAKPQRNVWGGPPDGGSTATLAAGKTAFAPRGKLELATVINRDIWEIGYKMKRPTPAPVAPTGSKSMGLLFGMLLLLGLGVLAIRRRRW